MTVPRSIVVPRNSAGVYHCISRCVRRAFLCGGEFEHRKGWVCDRLRTLASVFAIDVGGYAVMSNHLHVVLRTDPDRARGWSDREVARRWLRIFPGAKDLTEEARIGLLLADPVRVEIIRLRLGDLSWFMRCLNEPIARWANREDGCTGRFWEGRFKCHALLDSAAILACLVYVDLNVIRAAIADRPEDSQHTSVHERILARHHARGGESATRGPSDVQRRLFTNLPPGQRPRHAEDGIWLAPIEDRASAVEGPAGTRRRGLLRISLDQYLTLVDLTGRLVASGKAGSIPTELAEIMHRIGVDADRWRQTMGSSSRLIGTAIGCASSLAREAARRSQRWVVGALDAAGLASSARQAVP